MDDLWPGYTLSIGLSRQLDTDGLVTYTDPVQLRLAQIENSHQMELQNLHRQLQFARSVLQHYASGHSPDIRDDCVCISVGNQLEFHSRSSVIIGWHQPINFPLYNRLGLVIKDYISINIAICMKYVFYIHIYLRTGTSLELELLYLRENIGTWI